MRENAGEIGDQHALHMTRELAALFNASIRVGEKRELVLDLAALEPIEFLGTRDLSLKHSRNFPDLCAQGRLAALRSAASACNESFLKISFKRVKGGDGFSPFLWHVAFALQSLVLEKTVPLLHWAGIRSEQREAHKNFVAEKLLNHLTR